MLKSRFSPRRTAALTVQLLRGLELPTQFLVTVVAANSMGPQSFGRFGVLLAIQALLTVIAAFGYDELLQRAVSRDRSQLTTHLSRALSARLALAFVLVLLGVLGSVFIALTLKDADLAFSVALLSVAAAVNLISALFTSTAVSLSRVTVPFLASLLSWVAPLTLALAGFVQSMGTFALALALGACARLVLTLVWAFRGMKLGRTILGGLKSSSRPKLLDSRSSHLSLVVYALNNQVLARHGDILVGGALGVSLALLGSYSLAFQITAMANSFLMMGLGSVALSYLSERSGDDASLGQAWRRISGIAGLIAIGPICVLALTSPELVGFIFGDRYPLLTELMLWLCLAQWGNRLGGGGTNTGTLIAAGMSSTVARSSVGGGLLNVSLNFLFVPWLGVYGLVVGTGLSLFAIGALNTVSLSRRLRTLPPVVPLIGFTFLLLAAVGVTALGVAMEWRWIAASVIFVLWSLAVMRAVRQVRV